MPPPAYIPQVLLSKLGQDLEGCVQYPPAVACLFPHISPLLLHQVMLCNYSLQLCIDEVHKLRTSQSATDVGAMLKSLSLQVRCVQTLTPVGGGDAFDHGHGGVNEVLP